MSTTPYNTPGTHLEIHRTNPPRWTTDLPTQLVKVVAPEDDDDTTDSVTFEIIAEWDANDDEVPLSFDQAGETWTLYDIELAAGGIEVRVVQDRVWDAVATVVDAIEALA